jgi:hypothetical protein
LPERYFHVFSLKKENILHEIRKLLDKYIFGIFGHQKTLKVLKRVKHFRALFAMMLEIGATKVTNYYFVEL